MKKRLLIYVTILLASCTIFSCSEDEDPNWVIHKLMISKSNYEIVKNWNDTIYNKPEEYVMAAVALFKLETNNSFEYDASYRILK